MATQILTHTRAHTLSLSNLGEERMKKAKAKKVRQAIDLWFATRYVRPNTRRRNVSSQESIDYTINQHVHKHTAFINTI
jgi:hypothetical protein